MKVATTEKNARYRVMLISSEMVSFFIIHMDYQREHLYSFYLHFSFNKLMS